VPEGCFLNPSFPAACTAGNETTHRIANTVLRALAKLPYGPRVAACDHGSSNNLFISGRDQRGELRILYQYPEGGWGAVEGGDGVTLFSFVGNCRNMPAEAIEYRNPLRVRRHELREDSGGPGRWRGGLGSRRDYELLADEGELSFIADRCKIPPYGLHGGCSAAPGDYLIDRAKGFERASPTFVSKGAAIPLKRGDIVSQRTAGGGGFGDPHHRPLHEIEHDLREGYISPGSAEDHYGVVVTRTPAGLQLSPAPGRRST
jgi:N-methylhydantoinase B